MQWAKAGIVNTYILSNSEVEPIKKIIKAENMPYSTVIEAIEFSDIKIAVSNKSLLYILSLPTSDESSCKTMIIRAIKKEDKIVKLNYPEILKCENKLFGINKKCKALNNLTMCKRNDIVDISNDNCISNLIISKPYMCKEINNQHIPVVEEIAPGIVLLNQFRDNIYIDERKILLNGTYLIQFHNATVKAYQYVFQEAEITKYNPLPAVLQPPATKSQVAELLSLEMFKEIEMKNTKYIEELKSANDKKSAAILSLSALILMMIIFLICKKPIQYVIRKCKEASKNDDKEATTEDITMEPSTNKPVPAPKTIGVDDLCQHLRTV